LPKQLSPSLIKTEPDLEEQQIEAERQQRAGRAAVNTEEVRYDPYIQGFELGRIIGSGMIGLAYVAKFVETGEIYCLKCMSQEKIAEKNLVKNIENEIKFHLELIDVPHIMPLLKLMVAPLELVMVFPFIPGRDLFRFMR
jgi:serine/threonine protein kinase